LRANGLAFGLWARSTEHLGNENAMRDLDEAIELWMKIVFLSPVEYGNKPMYTKNLYGALTAKFNRTKRVDSKELEKLYQRLVAFRSMRDSTGHGLYHEFRGHVFWWSENFITAIEAFEMSSRVASDNNTPVDDRIHLASCDRCERYPIKGLRHKCAQCLDYDLCTECMRDARAGHELQHEFITIPQKERRRHFISAKSA
jgi:hypothetical protein